MEIANTKYPGSIVYFSSDYDGAPEHISHFGILAATKTILHLRPSLNGLREV